MEFKNSNQLMEYWETKVKEFEKELGIKNGETSSDMQFTLGSLRCVGACGLAPVLTINDKVYGHVTTADVKTILSEYK